MSRFSKVLRSLLTPLVLGSCAPIVDDAQPGVTTSGLTEVTTQPDGTAGWTDEVSARLRDARRAFVRDGAGFTAQVPEQQLRGYFDFDGARLSFGNDDVSVRMLAFGREGMSEAPIAHPALGACAKELTDPAGDCVRRLEYASAGLLGWWIADGAGFEQGWTVDHPPDGTGPLTFDLGIDGAEVTVGDGEAWLQGHAGGLVIVSGLAAWDADGQPLAVKLLPMAEGLRIEVDDEAARYPIEVDPTYSTTSWTLEGTAGNNPFANAVAGAGDVNGDGYADVIVTGYMVASAYVFYGSSEGFGWTAVTALTGTSGFTDTAVASAGDVDNDGFDDVIIGDPDYASNTGRVFVFHGSAAGVLTTATTTLTGSETYSDFGASVASAGDVDNDGFADIIVGAPEYGVGTNYGRATVYHGSSSGVAPTATTTLMICCGSDLLSSNFGFSVAGAGDVDNDGFDDVVVGGYGYSTETGRVSVFRGSASGISSTASTTLTGGGASYYFGFSVAGAGDVDGDGYDEVIVGAYGVLTRTGRAYVYAGSSSGTRSSISSTLSGDTTNDRFGWSVSSAGDVNGDGYADVIVGEPTYGGGRAYVYTGSLGGLNTTPWDREVGGGTAEEFVGDSVAGVGDTNGDGYDDVVIGAYGYRIGLGRAYVSLGGASALTVSTPLTGLADDSLGIAVDSAGDVNGDGFDDVVLGAYGYGYTYGRAYVYEGSETGLSSIAATTLTGTASILRLGIGVAGIGDVNNDGYADIAVGGAATSVYNGSPSGISSTASEWVSSAYYIAGPADVNGDGYDDLVVADSTNLYVYEGSSSGISLSRRDSWIETIDSVGSAGDVNGDGYDDVLIGYTDYASYTGRVWLYYGSSAGLTSVGKVTLTGYNVDDLFGCSVAGAGDINGDGYDDIVIGASGYDGRRGRAYFYHGSSSGLSTTLRAVHSGSSIYEHVAHSVAGAGDLDADGYDDVVITAHGYGSLFAPTGLVSIYAGSSSGISSTAMETLSSTATTARSAGDVNGDGLLDLLLGDPNAGGEAGAVYAHYGYVDADDDGYSSTVDCDDTDPTVTGPYTAFADVDGDTYGDADSAAEICGVTDGYVSDFADCDDTDASIHPGGIEVCDSFDADEDCDSFTDDADPDATGLGTWFADADGDGYGSEAVPLLACDPGVGFVGDPTDCDDGDAAINPAAAEACDLADVDEDCDGAADDADAVSSGKSVVYADSDGDGYGGVSAWFCDVPGSGYVSTSTDCDDASGAIHPGATEVCDAANHDEDCDTFADDDDASATGKSTFYVDSDGDTFGGGTPGTFCDAPPGYVASSTDCDDANAVINPDGSETCDLANTDEDCDGAADDADVDAAGKIPWYADADGDGYGGTTSTPSCDRPSGYVASSDDCDDGSMAISPAATEVCDPANTDEDCDRVADDLDPSVSGKTTFYIDADGDSFGGTSVSERCDEAAGYVSDSTDCNDASAADHPGATETVGNEGDEDCDGAEICYADDDADGFRGVATVASSDTDCSDAGEAASGAHPDCDDEDATIRGGATEIVGNSLDEDCDGSELCYVDADADGFRPDDPSTVASADLDCHDPGEGDDSSRVGDCDDTDDAYHPGADEGNCADLNDYNCDGSSGYADADGDGFAACEECDDARTATNPDATEVCNDRDDDCDGGIDTLATDAEVWYADEDGDGYVNPSESVTECDPPQDYAPSTEPDCDDADATSHPDAVEVPDDGVDQDCDGDDLASAGNEDTGVGSEADCGCVGVPGAPSLGLLLGAAALARRRRS